MAQVITCVVLTYKSYSYKGGCIEHTLEMLRNQSFKDFRVILVENSGECKDRHQLQSFVKISRFDFQVELVLTDCLSPSAARNIGVKKSDSELIVFIDDDTLLLTRNALSEISRSSASNVQGYGAVRRWTQPLKWFENNAAIILNDIKSNNFMSLKKNLDLPQTEYTRV